MKKLLMMFLALSMFCATASMASDTPAAEPAEAAVEKTAVETASGEGEPSKWSKASDEIGEAAHAVGDATVDTSKKVWDVTKEESVEAWDKAKSKSKEIWEKSKAKVHDVTSPEAAAPDEAAPDEAAPDAATPDAVTPEAAVPDTPAPDAQPLENN